jgi:hypothetical protein
MCRHQCAKGLLDRPVVHCSLSDDERDVIRRYQCVRRGNYEEVVIYRMLEDFELSNVLKDQFA